VGLFQNQTLIQTWRLRTHPVPTSDELKAKLQLLLTGTPTSLAHLEAVVVSSVVPEATRSFRFAFPEQIKSIDSHWSFSFGIEASPPESVGTDRLVNAEAALRSYGSPVLIVDSGTATTLCAVNHSGNYLGGAILPGIEMAMGGLVSQTAMLASADLTPPSRAIGRNTPEALQSGILLGHACMVDGILRKFREELGDSRIPAVATGGISLLLKDLLEEVQHFEPNLTLNGIRYLYESISS